MHKTRTIKKICGGTNTNVIVVENFHPCQADTHEDKWI